MMLSSLFLVTPLIYYISIDIYAFIDTPFFTITLSCCCHWLPFAEFRQLRYADATYAIATYATADAISCRYITPIRHYTYYYFRRCFRHCYIYAAAAFRRHAMMLPRCRCRWLRLRHAIDITSHCCR